MTPEDRYHFEPMVGLVESAIERGESVGSYHHSEVLRLLRAALAAARRDPESEPPKTYNYQMGYEAGQRDAARRDPEPDGEGVTWDERVRRAIYAVWPGLGQQDMRRIVDAVHPVYEAAIRGTEAGLDADVLAEAMRASGTLSMGWDYPSDERFTVYAKAVAAEYARLASADSDTGNVVPMQRGDRKHNVTVTTGFRYLWFDADGKVAGGPEDD